MIPRSKFEGYTRDGVRVYPLGGGGSNTTQSTGTTYNTNVPEYARPYVENMLGATQRQLFEIEDTPSRTEQYQTGADEYGNPIYGTREISGSSEITGFKPYQAYSQNPADYVAGFSPMQQQAQRTVAGMEVPGTYGAAADVTGRGIMGAMGTAGQAQGLMGLGRQATGAGNQYMRMATSPYATQAFMSPYMQDVVDVQQREAIRQSNMQRVADQAQAVKAGAYGGSRQALVEAERQRNLGTQLGGIQAQGLQSAFDKAQQAQQFGANLGLQGMQTGAGIMGQGIGAQQAAYNQAMQGAQQYANLGGQALQAQQNIANLQNTYGAQQQAAEQQKINQAIQDWANTQQYPLMQLGVMSNMLRGLPMQASTTNQYVAAPNPITQGIGLAGAGASLYNAMKAEGGVIKSMASGGIASIPRYDVGGEVASQLEDMSVQQLQKEAQTSSSPTVRAMAKRILAQKQMEQAEASKGAGPMGVQYQAADGMAGGGIIAFNKGDTVSEEAAAEAQKQADRDAISRATSAVGKFAKDSAGKLAAAGADIATMVPRGIAGAVDSTAIRAARALGADVDYISPSLTPGDQASDTATPFYDRYIRAREDKKEALAEAPAKVVPAAATPSPRDDNFRRQTDPRMLGVPATAPAPAAPAPRGEGILQAAPAKAAPAPAAKAAPAPTAAKAAPAPAAAPAAPAESDIAKSIAEGKRPLSEFVAEQKAEYEKAGVDLENKAAQEQRAKIMAERANTADEAKRQQWMRAAEFFSRWGSTPGPTLAAGLSALQKTIPDMVSDKKEQKKVERELDKMAYDIDQAIRLEKKGLVDEAVKKKEKAADRGMHLQQTLMTSEATRYSAEKHLEGTKVTAAAHRETAAATRESTAAYREAQLEGKRQDQYRNALTNQTNVLAEIARERQGKTYLQLEQDAKIPATAGGTAAERRAKAIAELERINKDHNERVKEAKDTVSHYAERAGVPKTERTAPAQSVTVGDKTYNRPAGFTDAQWAAYKKDQGVK